MTHQRLQFTDAGTAKTRYSVLLWAALLASLVIFLMSIIPRLMSGLTQVSLIP